MTDQIPEANQDTQHHRSIRSYVLRQSHMTAAQRAELRDRIKRGERVYPR